MFDIKNALDTIAKDCTSTTKNQIVEFITGVKNDTEPFIKEMGQKMEKYVLLLSDQKITKDEFSDLVKGIATLQEINAAKISVQSKVRGEKILNGIQEIVLKGLLSIINV